MPICLFLRKTYFSSRKNIFQTKHRSHRIFPMIAYFPFVYVMRLLHTFDWRYSSLFLFILLCNCYGRGWIVRILRQWDFFFPIFSCLPEESRGLASKFLSLSKWRFFFPCQHVLDQCVILKQTQWHLYENNVYFLPYNLLQD